MLTALRPIACFLSVALTAASFHLAHMQLHWLALVAVFLITATTMLQNDWRDRKHDAARKEKRLALDHEELFLCALILFWSWTLCLIAVIFMSHQKLGTLLAMMALAGAVYSETRRFPMAPITIVALTSASPVLLPVILGGDFRTVAGLLGAAALAMFSNEIVKDLGDEPADRGYKWTIPLALGSERAKHIAVAALGLALLVAARVSPWTLLGGIPIVMGAALLLKNGSPKTVEYHLDAGMGIVLLLLALSGQ